MNIYIFSYIYNNLVTRYASFVFFFTQAADKALADKDALHLTAERTLDHLADPQTHLPLQGKPFDVGSGEFELEDFEGYKPKEEVEKVPAARKRAPRTATAAAAGTTAAPKAPRASSKQKK